LAVAILIHGAGTSSVDGLWLRKDKRYEYCGDGC
jgi:hypothetical protein